MCIFFWNVSHNLNSVYEFGSIVNAIFKNNTYEIMQLPHPFLTQQIKDNSKDKKKPYMGVFMGLYVIWEWRLK